MSKWEFGLLEGPRNSSYYNIAYISGTEVLCPGIHWMLIPILGSRTVMSDGTNYPGLAKNSKTVVNNGNSDNSI
eukprot:3038432-Ditylum_brightwellii.AAC.1